MTRRNPRNERYTNENMAPKGQTRKSAAAAKPKRDASSTTMTAADKSKQDKEKKLSRKERKEESQEAFRTMGPRAREKYLEDEYVRWNTWRKRTVMIAFIALFIAMIYQYSLPPAAQNLAINVVLWILPFAAIGVGIWISFARQRPLGRLLGIEYGKKGRELQRKTHKERQESIKKAMEEDEARVKARVQEKNDRDAERQMRKLRARVAAEQEKEQKQQQK